MSLQNGSDESVMLNGTFSSILFIVLKDINGNFRYKNLSLKAYSRSNFLFILKVANIRFFILIAVEIFHYIIRRFLIFLYPLKNSMLTRTIFIYSVTYKVNLFGRVFAHVRNCLRKEKHMYGTNKNIDGFYTKTTQI